MQPEKQNAVEKYEAVLKELANTFYQSDELWQYVREERQRYPNIKIDDATRVEEIKAEIERRIINRYHGLGYEHVSSENIEFETRMWQFARNNPELWSVMTQFISWGETDVQSYLGFSLMDSIIHNGVYDDWDLELVEHEGVICFKPESDASFKNGKRINQYLSEKSMKALLDKLEGVDANFDVIKNKPKV
jgi:hypothetical protein